MVLYKLTNLPFTATITNSDLEDIIVFYKPSTGPVENNKTIRELFTDETVEIQSTSQIGTSIEEIIYGTTTKAFTIYNVTAQETVEIGSKTIELTEGIYALGNPDSLAEDIHPIKKADQVVRLDVKYIPLELIQRISTIENNYATITYVNDAI